MKAIKTMLKALRLLLGRKADKTWVEDTYLKKTDTPNVTVPVPDWDINDPDEGGYIKNRIAYKEYRDYGDNYHFTFTNGTLTGMKSDELEDSAVGEYVKKYATETTTKRNFTLTNGYYVSNNEKNQTSISYGTLKFNFGTSTAVRIDYEFKAAYSSSDKNIAVISKAGVTLSDDATYNSSDCAKVLTASGGTQSGNVTIYVPAGEQTVTFKYIKQNTNSITGNDYFKLRAILPAKTLKELFLKYIHTPLRTALASKDYDYKMIMVVEGKEYDARMTSYYEGQGRDYIISDGTYNGDYGYYGKKYRISYSGGSPNASISITTGADEDPLVMPTGSTTVIFKKLYIKQLATEFAPNGNVRNGTPVGSVIAAGANDGKGQNGLQVGYGATADGENSVAFARGNAGGEQSFAMPGGNASGYNSIAARRGQATGSNSIAIDRATGEFWNTGYSTAAGDFAVAVGDSLNATHDNQYVIGEYNLDEDSAFTYGNGKINKRSNAFMFKKDGSAFFAGDVYANVEKGLGSNAKEGNKLVTNTELGTAVNSKLDAPTTATAGQVIAVKTVDEDGKITEVEAVDMSGGSGGMPNAVQYVAQSLTDEQKAQARENIGAGTSSFSGSYNDLADKPTIPEGYTLPVAASDVLGGVKPAAKTDAMTSAVGVDADGKLWSVAGGGEWELINSVTIPEDAEETNAFIFTTDKNGNSFALKTASFGYRYPAYTGESTIPGYCFARLNNGNGMIYTGLRMPDKEKAIGGVWTVDFSHGQQIEEGVTSNRYAPNDSEYTDSNPTFRKLYSMAREGTISSIGMQGALIFPGCKFELYGVRA